MATSSSFLSEDQFQCSICLEVFTEPVSTPCGHNFCKACLTRHWAGKEQYQCPLCNEKFNNRLKLATNTGLREVVENFKKHHVTADSTPLIKPGQVPCDCCPGHSVRAHKTCLVCLTSFCKTHLEPHQRVAALKRHKLTNPVQNLENKICKKHNRIVEFFCRNDNAHACVLCTEHSNHDTARLEEEYVDRMAEIKTNKVDVQEQKQKQKQGKETRIKMAAQKKKKGKGGAKASSVVSNQMLHPYPLFVPIEDTHLVCGHSCIPAFTPNHRGRNWTTRHGDNRNTVVFVDHENGVLFLSNVRNAILLSFIDVRFNERNFLLLNLRPFQTVSWTQRLRRRVRNIVEHPQAAYFLFALIFYFMLVLVFSTEEER